MKLSEASLMILKEARFTDPLSSRTDVTYEELIRAIVNTKEGKPTKGNLAEIQKVLAIKSSGTLRTYIKNAKKSRFITADDEVNPKYAVKVGGKSKPAPKAAPKPAASPAPLRSKNVEIDRPAKKSGKIASGGKISASLNKKITNFRAPKVSGNNVFSKQIFNLLTVMQGQAKASGIQNSLMLTGDPGTGKTSFIRNFANLVGLPLITIEAPHITEEHIINIPFMIIKDNKVQKDSASLETAGNHTLNDDASSFDIVQAESNLVTKLKSMKSMKLSPTAHIKSVARDKNLRPLYKTFRPQIDSVRQSYNCILFLDEYYRNDNMKIRNILRNILNGRIGNDKIPTGVYIVYASNLNDEGVESIPMNNDFAEMDFATPDREQWFDYILKKYETNEHKDFPGITLNETVFNKFYDKLGNDILSYNDTETEVRSSPRRWEQLLMYVNANLPVSNETEAHILMSNVQANFSNYLEGSVSDIYPQVKELMIELIKETSDITFNGNPHPETEWKDVLEQQLATKIKMDSNSESTDKEARKYVPVISGEPGIGKTSHMTTVADNLGLHFISVDAATLTSESTTGIPKSSDAFDEDGNQLFDHNGNPVMTTMFSKPELLDLIEKMMAEAVKADSIFPEAERKQGNGRYKFLLLFDELTRVENKNVFNSVRKILLEKSFNEDYDLPPSIMVVGALNPKDEGVETLTSHTRDVLDIIPARASWASTEAYLLSKERPAGLEEALAFDCNTATVGALKILLNQYKTSDVDWRNVEVHPEERMFNLVDGADIIYFSPREITDAVSMINSSILARLTSIGLGAMLDTADDVDDVDDMSDEDFEASMLAEEGVDDYAKRGIYSPTVAYSDDDLEAFIDAIIVEFRDTWASKISFTIKKQDIDPANFLSVTTGFIMKNLPLRDQYVAIKTQKVNNVKTIAEIFGAFYENPEDLYESTHLDNYLVANITSPLELVREVTEFMGDKSSEIQQSNAGGTIKVTTTTGRIIDFPALDHEILVLYTKYLAFILVIFRILSDRADYAGEKGEAQSVGQFVSFVHTSLQQTGRSFMMDHKLVTHFANTPGKTDGNDKFAKSIQDDITRIIPEIVSIMDKFNIERKER